MTHSKPCLGCAKEFLGHHRTNRYCSRFCAVRHRTGSSRLTIISKLCPGCGQKFDVTGRKKLRKFCSPECNLSLCPSRALVNAAKGEATELEAQHILTHHLGYLTVRMRASRGPFDILGVNESGVIYVQVKLANRAQHSVMFPDKAAEYLRNSKWGEIPNSKLQIWAKLPSGEWFAKDVRHDTTGSITRVIDGQGVLGFNRREKKRLPR